MTRNADRYTMYAVTLPGFARSDPPAAPPDDIPYSVAPWLQNSVNAILKLIDERGLDKPVILGVSTGGHIALRVAIAAPEKLRAAVTLNGLPVVPLHNTTMMPQVTRDRIVREEFAAYWKSCPEEEWAAQQETWIRASFPNTDRAKAILGIAAGTPKTTTGRYMIEYFASDLTDRLSSLNLPVLAITWLPKPTDSQYQTLKDGWKTMFAKLPQAKLAYFEGSGEFITEDSPAELDRALQQFLDGKPVEGKSMPIDKRTFESRPSNVQPLPAPAHPSDAPRKPEPK
jgi:pimeloyl-ACP methyl ester carboxylesterase